MNDLELFHLIRRVDSNFRSIIQKNKKNTTKSHGHGRILHVLKRHPGINQSELAAKMQIQPQSLTSALVSLEEEGYIVRKRSENDRREVEVLLTKEGESRCAEIMKAREEAVHILFENLNEKEKETLSELLLKIVTIEEK